LSHAVAIKLEKLLFFLLAFARLLAASSGNKVLVLSFAGESLAFWELLAGTFVGLADLKVTAKLELLLGLFSKILLEALGLDFRFFRFLCLAIGSLSFGVLFVGFGNIFTSLLILPFSVASGCAPAVTNLFIVITDFD
jgi:hypothetical protein